MQFKSSFWLISLLLLSSLTIAGWLWKHSVNSKTTPPIEIGVLHSLTSDMASNESMLVDAIRLAVEEINADGGLNGRSVEMQIVDIQSDADKAAHEVERLITQQKVSALFGCWTSTCRLAVKPIVEQQNHLLFYPLQYEGMEQSPNIVYLGALPNQQIIPATRWALNTLGKRVFLIGSDDIYPHAANLIISELLKTTDATLLAERYVKLGNTDFASIMAELQRLKPDVIINTINGSSNSYFFRALHHNGLYAIPVLSFSMSEVDLGDTLPTAFHPNHYAAWNYFMSLPGKPNAQFIKAFHDRYGSNRITSGPIATVYTGVKLWAQAVQDIGTDNPIQVSLAMQQQSIASPFGLVTIDSKTRHLWLPCYIGKALSNGQFELVWQTTETLRPTVFPEFHSVIEWKQLMESAP